MRMDLPTSLATYFKDLVRRTSAPPLEKQRATSRTYDLENETLEALCTALGIEYALVRAAITKNSTRPT